MFCLRKVKKNGRGRENIFAFLGEAAKNTHFKKRYFLEAGPFIFIFLDYKNYLDFFFFGVSGIFYFKGRPLSLGIGY